MAKKKNGRYIQSKGNRFEKNTDTVHTESTRHINHKDKYIGLNERTENHNIHNPPDITQKETGSSFQTEKQKKDMRKQIDSFQKEEKESRDAVTENAGNSLTVDNGRAGFEDNTKTYKTFAEGTRHKDKSVDVNEDTHSYGWKKNVRINRRQYKAHLEDNFSKVKSEDENKSKSNQKKYFKGNFEEKEFTRNKGNKDRKKENKDNRISQKSAKKFEKQEKKISKLQHKKEDL